MSSVESQIKKYLQTAEGDLDGAQDLIDAHLDEVSGGGFSLHVQFGTAQEQAT